MQQVWLTSEIGNEKMLINKILPCFITLFLGLASVSLAQTGVSDAIESDPNTMGWMQGFPPSDDRVIGHPASDYFSFPKLRWTFCHFREIQATRRVARGRGPSPHCPNHLTPPLTVSPSRRSAVTKL